MPKWVQFDEARIEIADRLISLGIEEDWIEAMKAAEGRLIRALACGELPSRTSTEGSFSLSFESGAGCSSTPLAPDREIPALFWYHFQEAVEEDRGLILLQDKAETAAPIGGNAFHFRLTGLRDDGTLEGIARGVEILRSRVPGLPAPRGRPIGASKLKGLDEPIVQKAINAIRSGEMTEQQAVAHYWELMDKRKGMENAIKKRFRRRLREALTQTDK